MSPTSTSMRKCPGHSRLASSSHARRKARASALSQASSYAAGAPELFNCSSLEKHVRREGEMLCTPNRFPKCRAYSGVGVRDETCCIVTVASEASSWSTGSTNGFFMGDFRWWEGEKKTEDPDHIFVHTIPCTIWWRGAPTIVAPASQRHQSTVTICILCASGELHLFHSALEQQSSSDP